MSTQSKQQVIAKIVDVSLRSAQAEEINIIELESLNQLVSKNAAEEIRKEFTKYNTPIKQITNTRKFVAWTANTKLIQNLSVKYVPKESLDITNELLIFGDTVAVYRLVPDPFYAEVNDASYADMMRAVFANIWALGDGLLMAADGSTLTKQYLPVSYTYKNIPVVVYPAKDDGVLEKAFERGEKGGLEQYVNKILEQDKTYFESADMVLAYVWNQDEVPYCDMWKINRNDISDDSGFLYDVKIYKGTNQITDLGVASGNTSIVLTAEEMLLRDLIFGQGLSFKEAADRSMYQARFPLGFVPAESFYKN